MTTDLLARLRTLRERVARAEDKAKKHANELRLIGAAVDAVAKRVEDDDATTK